MQDSVTYTSFEQLPLVLSVDQLAQVLGIGKNYAYDLLRCGQIQSIRVGHRFRIPKEAIVNYIKTPHN